MNAKRTGIIVAIPIILFVVVFIFCNQRPTGPALPDLQNVTEMTAALGDTGSSSEIRFNVPKEHWKPIFDSLTPAQRDQNAATWVGLGELNIKLKNGEPFHISLFQVSDGPGAFSSGRTFKSRTYYRGGNTAKLVQSLTAARTAATLESTK